MENLSTITFTNGLAASVLQVTQEMPVSSVLQQLGLMPNRPVLVVIGGASKLSPIDFDRVRSLFIDVLAPIAEQWHACVIDGGTDTGVMRLMGQARAAVGGTFPLIGVAPIGLITLPGDAPRSEDEAPLEPHHTHIVLVPPGSQWGDESPWLAEIASKLADNAPSVTVLINGGEVTWIDASENVQEGRSLLVIAGTGRTADLIAAGLRGEPTDARAVELIKSGHVQAIDLTAGTEVLASIIEKIFAAKE